MSIAVSEVLAEKLGDRAALELQRMFADAQRDWKEDVLSVSTDRFERRLGEEMGRLRVEMHQGFATTRVEILRWSFLFWIGQVAATAGLLMFFVRALEGH